ncbi:MAG: hypothetical protein ACI9VS_001450 [Candidatus Binatia bacterium]|jgi:hypothetical protein
MRREGRVAERKTGHLGRSGQFRKPQKKTNPHKNMKNSLTRRIGVAVAICALTTSFSAMAQQRGGGGFDREAMMKMMKERFRTALEIKNDDEWAIIGERIDKVSAARQAVPTIRPSLGSGRPGRGGGERGGQGGEQARGGERGGQGGEQARSGQRGGGRTGGSRFGGTPNPKAEALTKALESGDEGAIKSALAAFRSERASKTAALEKAQDSLKELLTVKQEGTALTMGLVR